LIFLIFLKNINIQKPHILFRIMSVKKEREISCEACSPSGGYSVEAVLAVDDRGQMVLPKDIRQRAGIHSGDKLALISWERDGKVCCLVLMKVENLSGMVKDVLGPMMHDTEH
jgi:AbrB family looped-hinge helix DNA binding protein